MSGSVWCWSIPRVGPEMVTDLIIVIIIIGSVSIVSFLFILSFTVLLHPYLFFLHIPHSIYEPLSVVTAVPNWEWVLPIPLSLYSLLIIYCSCSTYYRFVLLHINISRYHRTRLRLFYLLYMACMLNVKSATRPIGQASERHCPNDVAKHTNC